MLFEVGRVCVKLLGRDAGMKCVIVDVLDNHMVVIDGETRRRKCNVKHLEPLDKVVSISKGASSADVAKHAKELDFVMRDKKAGAAKKEGKAPRKERVQKQKPVKAPKKEAAVKKEAAPKAKKADKQ